MPHRGDFLQLDALAGDALRDLREQAVSIRDRHWGRVVTYSRKVFIPLTTLCRDDCGYCTFVRKPGTPGARYMTPDDVLRVAEEGRRLGCKEALFSLGEKPELRYPEARSALAALGYERTVDYLRDMCAMVLERTGLLPHANPGTLSEDDLRQLKPVTGSMGMMLESVSRRLTRPGQPHHACPDKVPVQRLRTLERAGEVGVPFTTGILIGIGETWEERVDSLLAINEVHARYGHIQEVIIQNFRAKPDLPMADHPEPTHEDMLRTLAVARVLLDPTISLQAPPNLQERYADYIGVGLNDWGGISPLTIDHINPEHAWPQVADLRKATEDMGCALRERLTIYPGYIRQPDAYLARPMTGPVRALARADGLAAAQDLA
jgi:FO synthase